MPEPPCLPGAQGCLPEPVAEGLSKPLVFPPSLPTASPPWLPPSWQRERRSLSRHTPDPHLHLPTPLPSSRKGPGDVEDILVPSPSGCSFRFHFLLRQRPIPGAGRHGAAGGVRSPRSAARRLGAPPLGRPARLGPGTLQFLRAVSGARRPAGNAGQGGRRAGGGAGGGSGSSRSRPRPWRGNAEGPPEPREPRWAEAGERPRGPAARASGLVLRVRKSRLGGDWRGGGAPLEGQAPITQPEAPLPAARRHRP